MRSIAIPLGIVILIYMVSWSPYWVIKWDSAIYLKLADNIIAHHSYSYNGEEHYLYPPGYPLLLAVVKYLSNNSLGILRMVQLVLGFLAILVSWVLCRRLVGDHSLMVTCALIGTNAELLRAAIALESDTPFLLVSMGLTLFCLNMIRSGFPKIKKLIFLSVLTLLLCSLRLAGGGLILGIILGVLLVPVGWSFLQRFLVCGVLSFSGLMVFAGMKIREIIFDRADDLLTYNDDFAQWTIGEFLYRIYMSIEYFQEAVYATTFVPGSGIILLGIIGVGIVHHFNDVNHRFCFYVVIGYLSLLLCHYAGTAPRFLVPIMPIIILWFVQGIWVSLNKLTSFYPRHALKVRVILGLYLVLIFVSNVGHCLKYIHTSHRAWDIDWYRHGIYRDYHRLAGWLMEKQDKGVLYFSGKEERGAHHLIHYWTDWMTRDLSRNDSKLHPQLSFVVVHQNDMDAFGTTMDPFRRFGDLLVFPVEMIPSELRDHLNKRAALTAQRN